MWAIVFPLAFLAVSAMMFSGSIDDGAITHNVAVMTCVNPSITGVWNNTGSIEYTGATYNYPDASNSTLTLTCSSVHTLDGVDYCYGCPVSSFFGYAIFAGDYISRVFETIGAFFGLIGIILGASIPVDVITQAPLLAIPYAFIFIVLGYGIVTTLPFFGGAP